MENPRPPCSQIVLLLTLLAGLFSGAATPGAPESPLRLRDLLDLARAGLSEDLVREEVKSHGLDFHPTPQAIRALKEAGLGGAFLTELIREAGLSIPSEAPRETVRMFERRGADGRRFLVITNLDEDGNVIQDPAEEDLAAVPPASAPESPRREISPEKAGCAADATPAPLVVVNVQTAEPAAHSLPLYPVWTGSIIGPYRYPDRIGFLGYGSGVASPGWFSGLGLNPGNNYGHRKEDKPNTEGLDAFFGPPPR